MSHATQRFWVIGGVYADMQFQALKDGAQALFGPFESREEAQAKWKALSLEHSSSALTRFSIAAEGAR
jgi:hypothetical protein